MAKHTFEITLTLCVEIDTETLDEWSFQELVTESAPNALDKAIMAKIEAIDYNVINWSQVTETPL